MKSITLTQKEIDVLEYGRLVIYKEIETTAVYTNIFRCPFKPDDILNVRKEWDTKPVLNGSLMPRGSITARVIKTELRYSGKKWAWKIELELYDEDKTKSVTFIRGRSVFDL